MRDRWLGRLFVRFREQRDGRALAAVFDATARELIGVAAHLVPTADLAEDVVQSTFQRAIEHADRYDGAQSLKGWLYGILWREAAKVTRAELRTPIRGALEEKSTLAPEEEVAGRELPASVLHAIARVPAPYREVLTPALIEERDAREIATRLGRSPGTIRVQLQRGLERLRRELPHSQREVASRRAFGIGGLASLRARVLEHAGVANTSVPAASTAFLAAQLASTAVPTLGWLAAATAIAGAILGATYLTDRRRPEPSIALAPAGPPRGASPEPVSALASVETRGGNASTPSRRAVRPPDSLAGGTIRVRLAERVPASTSVALAGLSPEVAHVFASGKLDAVGQHDFEELAAGRYRVTASSVAGVGLAPVAIDLAEAETRDVVLEVGSCSLSGHVTSAGREVPSGVVALRSIRGGSGQAVTAEIQGGAYSLRGLVPGSFELRARAGDALTFQREIELVEAATVCDLVLPAGRIEGRLAFDRAEEEPGFRAMVFPYGWYQESGSRGVIVDPDADGRFVAHHLPPGDFVVSAWRPSAYVESRVVTISEAAPVQQVVLARSDPIALGVLEGRIDVPAGGARPSTVAIAMLKREPQGLRRVGYAEVEAGTFEEPVEPGSYALLVSAFRGETPFQWIPEVQIAAGATGVVNFAVPASREVAIELDAGDEWTPQATWRLAFEGGEWLPFVFFIGSETEGLRAGKQTFRLPPGRYDVEADFGDPTPVVGRFDIVLGEGVQELRIVRPPVREEGGG